MKRMTASAFIAWVLTHVNRRDELTGKIERGDAIHERLLNPDEL